MRAASIVSGERRSTGVVRSALGEAVRVLRRVSGSAVSRRPGVVWRVLRRVSGERRRGQVLLCGECCVAGVGGSSVAGRCQRGRCDREGCDGECDGDLVEMGVGAHRASPLA